MMLETISFRLADLKFLSMPIDGREDERKVEPHFGGKVHAAVEKFLPVPAGRQTQRVDHRRSRRAFVEIPRGVGA